MASIEVKTVLSTVQDGRAKDLRYRQRHFLSLHQWITGNLVDIEAAVRKDCNCSELEARFMVSLTLQALKEHYDALDLKKELEEEYRIKNGRNNAGGNSPENLVYILPEKFTLFYSVMSALFACIAGGSCCIIEVMKQIYMSLDYSVKTDKKFDEQLPTDLTHSVSVTRQCLSQALDSTAFVATSTRPSSDMLIRCLVVDQTGSVPSPVGRRVLRSQPRSCTVAIVDRTADLKLATKEILGSRTLFSGKGPYAPNFILVNEFVEQDFIRLVREQLSAADGHHSIADKNVLLNAAGLKIIKIHKRLKMDPL